MGVIHRSLVHKTNIMLSVCGGRFQNPHLHHNTIHPGAFGFRAPELPNHVLEPTHRRKNKQQSLHRLSLKNAGRCHKLFAVYYVKRSNRKTVLVTPRCPIAKSTSLNFLHDRQRHPRLTLTYSSAEPSVIIAGKRYNKKCKPTIPHAE